MPTWAETMLTTGSRSFQRGTMSFCELVKWLQTYGLSKWKDNPIVQDSNPGRVHVVRLRLCDRIFFSNNQLWQLVTLHPFDLKRPRVPLIKDVDPVVSIISAYLRDQQHFKIGFALSKRPHFYIGLIKYAVHILLRKLLICRIHVDSY